MKKGSIFELEGVPRLQEACPLALQHVVAMIVGCVTPAIIVAGAVGGGGLSGKDRVILIQASLVMSALSTLIQLFPIGKKAGFAIGSGLPMIMGVSFAYVPSMQAIAEGYGVATIFGAQIVGGIVALASRLPVALRSSASAKLYQKWSKTPELRGFRGFSFSNGLTQFDRTKPLLTRFLWVKWWTTTPKRGLMG